LLGDPGVGKTTLIQWLVCSFCHWNDNYAKKQIGRFFPLVLTARKLRPDMASEKVSNEAFIDAVMETQGDELAALLGNPNAQASLLQLLNSGQVLLLVDGLDEISPAMGHWLSEQLRQLLTDYPKSRLLLTSRIVGFDANAFWQVAQRSELPDEVDSDKITAERQDSLNQLIQSQGNFPSAFYLAPFSPAQRLQFAKNWAASYIPHDSEKRQAFSSEIAAISQYSVQLNTLSRIPVLLGLICFIQLRRGKLPNGRAELYQRIVETYLVAMDKARAITNQLGDEYDYQDIKNWLGKLALQMQAGQLVLDGVKEALAEQDQDKLDDLRHEYPAIGKERLLQLSESQLSVFLQLQLSEVVAFDQLSQHAGQVITYIKNRTGFLIPRGQIGGEEYYGFSHLSFLEYFAAYAIANLLPDLDGEAAFKQSLFATTDESAWGEIWQLVFEELSLTGSSRRIIEKQLDGVFEGVGLVFSMSLNPVRLPGVIVLYYKVLMNPAVKIAGNKRLNRQIQLALVYLPSQFIGFSLLTGMINELFTTAQELLVSQLVDCIKPEACLNLSDLSLDDYTWLSRLTKLLTLYLHNSNISDLRPLANFTELSSLHLNHTNISDLRPLANLTKLEWLDLNGTNISDLRPLANLTELSSLLLNRSNISDLRPLANLTELSSLDLNGTNISDLRPLANLTALEFLYLNGTNISDLRPLANLTALAFLYLEKTNISDLNPLLKLKKLSVLVYDKEIEPTLLAQLKQNGVDVR
jgi:hypothetical protein